MKLFLFCIILLCAGTGGICQQAKRDSLLRAVDQYAQSARSAADSFLNRQFPADVRLKAIVPYQAVYGDDYVQNFKNTALSPEESPEIRAMALNKIYQYVEADENLFNQVLQWFQNPETPAVLRDETLNLMGNLSFSSMAGVVEPYKNMMNDPDVKFRTFAFSKLLLYGDGNAQQLLIRGLEDPQSQLFEPALAIELLALSPKKEFYPVVYKLLLETKDEAARLNALQVLGPYREAREKIVAISRDPAENETFRKSALMALYSGDRENIVTYVSPLLQDKSAPPALQALGIQMGIDVRRSMAYRRSKKARKADAFDNLVREIAEGRGASRSRELREVANKYLLLVRPAF